MPTAKRGAGSVMGGGAAVLLQDLDDSVIDGNMNSAVDQNILMGDHPQIMTSSSNTLG